MVWRCTYLLESGKAGWSETYFDTSGLAASLPAASLRAIGLAGTRRGLSPPTVTFSALRVVDPAEPRKVLLTQLGFNGTFNVSGPTDEQRVDMPWTSMRIRVSGSFGDFRRVFLRGIPDSVTHFADGKVNDAAWTGVFNTFAARVVADGYGGVSIARGSNPRLTIEGLTPSTSGIVVSITAHGLVSGNLVRITRNNSSEKLNKVWTVTVLDADTFILRGTRRTTDPITVIQLGYLWKVTEFQWNPASCQLEAFSSRRVGRPFGLFRGRSRRK